MVTKKEQILIFKSADGPSVNVTFEGETLWLTQQQIATLFAKDVRTINEHILNIFSEDELKENATIRNFQIVQKEGDRIVKRTVKHYNLDLIISVGYRVNSKKGTQFRIWANQILKEYLLNGYVLNKTQLKEQTHQIKLLEAEINNIKSSHLIDHKLISEKINQLSHQVKSFSEILDEFQGENVILRRPEGGWYEG